MNKFYIFVFTFLINCSAFLKSEAQLFSEPYNYTPSATLGLNTQSAGAWTNMNGGDSILVEAGSLTYSGLLQASSGNKVTFGGAGVDYYRSYTSQTTGTVYCSFLLNITSLGSLNTTGGYAIGLLDNTTSAFNSTLWIRSSGANYNIGINPRTTAANTAWLSNSLSVNTTYLIVIATQIVSGLANDVSKIWLNPVSLGGAEPASSASVTNTTGTDLTSIQRVFLRQDGTTATPGVMQIDEMRVGTTWASVTPASNAPCTTPVDQPTGINLSALGTTTASGTFTPALSTPNKYLILLSNNSELTSLPIDTINYIHGDNIDDASVLSFSDSTSFSIDSLSPATTYYLYIFSVNSICTGGPKYLTTNPLKDTFTTTSGIQPCVAPALQPTSFVLSNINVNSIQGDFTAASGTDEYLVVKSLSSSLSGSPVNGVTYNEGDIIGGGTVVLRGAATSFISDSLTASTTYYFFVFGLNSQNCSGGPTYKTNNPLSTSGTTTTASSPCAVPVNQASALVLTGDNSTITGNFTASGDADSYLVLYSTSSSLTQNPVNGIDYSAGFVLGNATIVSTGSSTNFYVSNLTAATQYYLYVFAKNTTCTGGTKYKTSSPLTGSFTTSASATYNFYYGNLHAHSSYSDGNKDSTAFTPANDYAYAKNSLGMDFLGISEHNHAQAGMSLSNFALGVAQANAATTSNFVGLYGQEWGVISGGGHLLIYGIDSLIGWETNNYNVYVGKNDYIGTPSTTGTTGIFRKLNLNGNAFASYAHPNSNDYDNISNIAFKSMVDSCVVGSAIESGPAFSTNTSYSDYPTSVGFISYYTKMLSKGYHLGPFMDHDTHYTNFGRANENRLVVLAPSLTKANLYAGLKAKRFYATEDIDTKVTFTLNNQVMGSVFSGNTAPAISITVLDPTSTNSARSIKLMYGIPGSGVVATQIASSATSTLTYTDNNLVNGNTRYYYVDITLNGKRTITSPIWYTKTNAASATLTAGTALTEANLNTGTCTITLSNATFSNFSANPTSLSLGHFTLNNAPAGTTISSVQATSSTTATVTFNYNNTDFDSNSSNCSITIAAAALSTAASLTSSAITISAYNEVISSGTLTAFSNQLINTTSAEKSFQVSGSQLSGSLTINAPAGYQISTTSGSGFVNSVILTPNAAGTLAGTTIFIRFTPVAPTIYAGNIGLTSSKAVTLNTAVSGSGMFAVTACNSYVLNSNTYNSSGVYTTHYLNVAGQDSAVTFQLTIKNSTTSSTTVAVCDSFIWNGTTYFTSGTKTFTTTNAVGCDSIASLFLTIKSKTTSSTSATACNNYLWNGTNYTTSGIKTFVTTNAAGCDSTATLNLTIGGSQSSTTTVSACNSYLWNGTNYTTSGTKTFTTTSSNGCDSTAYLILTINNSSTSVTTLTACDNYLWNGTNYTTSGVKTFNTTNAAGCDSTATLNLTIKASSTSSTTVTACNNFLWNGTNYTTSGTKTFVTTNAAGCDSTATLFLTIKNNSSSTTSITICANLLPYSWNGITTYTGDTSYTVHLTNSVGCDSAALFQLTVNPVPVISASNTSPYCSGDTISLTCNGNGYTNYSWTGPAGYNSGLTQTLGPVVQNFNGLNTGTTWTDNNTLPGWYILKGQGTGTSTPPATAVSSLLVGTGSSTTGGMYNFANSTVTSDRALGSLGVNSISANGFASFYYGIKIVNTLPATVNSAVITYTGEQYRNGANTAIQSLTVDYSTNATALTAASGTWVNVPALTFNSPIHTATAAQLDGNDVLNKQTLTTTLTGLSLAAGDSIWVRWADLNDLNNDHGLAIDDVSITLQATNQNVSIANASLAKSGIYTVTASTLAGCTSTAQTNVTVNVPTTSTTNLSICSNQLPYTWNGITTYLNDTSYTVHLTNAAGCDSAATLNLTVKVATSSSTTITACNSYTWNGTTYTTSGDKIYHTTNSVGCDSTATLHLTINICLTTVNLTLFLQGYYAGGGQMLPVLLNQGIGNSSVIIDTVTVELHNSTSFATEASIKGLLNYNGTLSVSFPPVTGNYYIVIKHRNTLETWSANPVALSFTAPVSYDFSNLSTKAYGSNMIQVEAGVWALYSGDINQDGHIDAFDFSQYDQDKFNGVNGVYSTTDLNGDGVVNASDFPVYHANNQNGIYSKHP